MRDCGAHSWCRQYCDLVFHLRNVRLAAATLATVASAALVIASGELRPMPFNITGCAVILLAWALALRWRIVAGGSIGLLAWAVTQDRKNLQQAFHVT
jgi:hypothetical protein